MDSKQILQNRYTLEVLQAGTLYLGITQSCSQVWCVLSPVVLFAGGKAGHQGSSSSPQRAFC